MLSVFVLFLFLYFIHLFILCQDNCAQRILLWFLDWVRMWEFAFLDSGCNKNWLLLDDKDQAYPLLHTQFFWQRTSLLLFLTLLFAGFDPPVFFFRSKVKATLKETEAIEREEQVLLYGLNSRNYKGCFDHGGSNGNPELTHKRITSKVMSGNRS